MKINVYLINLFAMVFAMSITLFTHSETVFMGCVFAILIMLALFICEDVLSRCQQVLEQATIRH